MYRKLRTMVEGDFVKIIEDTQKMIESATCGSAMNDWRLKRLMTNEARQIISTTDAEMSIPMRAMRKMSIRAARIERKRIAEQLTKIESVEQADYPEVIDVSVEWHRSNTYNLNPTATVEAGGHTSTAFVTGCGYDKESAAVAGAMNRNVSVLRVWFDQAESGGDFEYGMLGVRNKMLPIMNGGCGMSAVIKVFDALGYDCFQSHGKMYDSYRFVRRKVQQAH